MAAVLGDIVGSRRFADQSGLLEVVGRELEWANARVAALQALQLTVGDEFQGIFTTVSAALDAALLVQLRLLARSLGERGPALIRVGVGWGEVTQSQASTPPFGQSGPAWWAARQALERVGDAESRVQWPRSLRTGFMSETGSADGAVNAFLLCRDQVLARMDARDARIALGLFVGERQVDVAADLGISQPAVAKRQRDKGAIAMFRAHEALREWVP